jgi:hypothetical protein
VPVTRPGFEPSTVIPVPWLLSVSAAQAPSPALHNAQVSPVVKEKSYFAPKQGLRREQGSEPCRGADLRQCRDPQGSGGVVPKLRVAAETGLESNLFSHVPRRAVFVVNGKRVSFCDDRKIR